MFVCPIPSVLEELLAGQVAFLDALFGQFLHHFCFGSDRCVVGAGHPAGIFAFHAGTAYEDILNRVVQHVSHVEHTRNVRRRNDHRIRLTSIRFATEQFVV